MGYFRSSQSKGNATQMSSVLGRYKLAFGILAVIVIASLALPTMLTMAGFEIKNPFGGEDEQTEFSASVPIEFIVKDEYQGGAVASATVDFYRHGSDVKEETLTTDSAGKKSSSYNYDSGESFDVSVVKSNSKYWFKDVTLPFYDTENMAANKAKHTIALDFWTIGTYSVSATDPEDVTIADNGDLNKTESGIGNTPTVTFRLRNTVANTGYKSSFDEIEGYDDNILILIKITGTGGEKAILKSPNWPYKTVSTDRYWGSSPSDASVTRLVASDGTVTQSGTYQVDVNLDLTNYVGDAADIIVYAYAYSDWSYFQYYGDAGSDAVLLDSITINICD